MAIERSETYIRSKRRPFSASLIRWPSPERALIISVANMTMKESASDTRMPAKISGSAAGSTTRRKICASLAPMLRADQTRMRGGARAVVGVDEHGIEAGQRDDQDLGEVADAEPEHEHRQHHDLRHRVGEEDERAQHLLEIARDAGGEAERDAEQRADGEPGQRAQQTRRGVLIELLRAERRGEVLKDLERPEEVGGQPAERGELPDGQDDEQQARAGEPLRMRHPSDDSPTADADAEVRLQNGEQARLKLALLEAVIGARRRAGRLELGIAVLGHDDDDRGIRQPLEPPRELDAVALDHAVRGEHEIGALALDRFQGFASGYGG